MKNLTYGTKGHLGRMYVAKRLNRNNHEDRMMEERIPLEEIIPKVVAEAFADYSLCSQWD